METTQHPVYGPNRPAAARAAFAELAAAQAEFNDKCTGWADYDSPSARRRLAAAKEIREHYREYGDSYIQHWEQI